MRVGCVFFAVWMLLSASEVSAAQRKRRRAVIQQVQPSEAKGRVVVRVVDIAAQMVFVEPGADEGITQGAWIKFGGDRYRVISVTRNNAVIKADPGALRIDDEGVVQGPIAKDAVPEGPLRAKENASEWVAHKVPSADQIPVFVPLDAEALEFVNPRQQLLVSAGVSATVPTDLGIGAIVRSEIRARAHLEPLMNAPLRLDMDVAAQRWMGRDLGAPSAPRAFLRVFQAELGYGLQNTLGGSVGRLRYAASTIGTLDGVRVQTGELRLGETSSLMISAFGGMVPNPMSGGVSTKATRFGIEAQYRDLGSAWMPTASLVAHGSMFEGQLDERRINGSFYLFPGRGRLGGFFEAAAFDPANVWRAPTFDLAAAGVDGSWQFETLSLGLRADMRKPERSNWLAAYFPRGYLCITKPSEAQAGANASLPETCGNFNVARYALTFDARLSLNNIMVSSSTGVVASGYETEPHSFNTYLGVRYLRLLNLLHLEISGTLVRGAWLNNDVLRASMGLDAMDHALEIDVYYRPSWIRYHRVANETWREQAVGGQLYYALSRHLGFQAYAELVKGYDVGVLLMQGNLVWRL